MNLLDTVIGHNWTQLDTMDTHSKSHLIAPQANELVVNKQTN
jgi:hypothetical protein